MFCSGIFPFFNLGAETVSRETFSSDDRIDSKIKRYKLINFEYSKIAVMNWWQRTVRVINVDGYCEFDRDWFNIAVIEKRMKFWQGERNSEYGGSEVKEGCKLEYGPEIKEVERRKSV
jgi:hypothetical protein